MALTRSLNGLSNLDVRNVSLVQTNLLDMFEFIQVIEGGRRRRNNKLLPPLQLQQPRMVNLLHRQARKVRKRREKASNLVQLLKSLM